MVVQGPSWLVRYEDVIGELRHVLYEFENNGIDFQSFINGINKSLISHGYSPIRVVISDFITSLFNAYAMYAPRRPTPIIYVSTELMRKPRALLGRVLMHEVFHHVLYQRPPSFLFKLAPRRVEPLILVAMPLMMIIIFTLLFEALSLNFLSYVVITLSLTMSLITAILIKVLNEHELVATSLVIYLITGKWVRDWAYYRSEDALINVGWDEITKPREVIAA